MTVLGLALLPLGFTPISQNLGRQREKKHKLAWSAYYVCQIFVLFVFIGQIFGGRLVEWKPGIFDEATIRIARADIWLFANVLLSCFIALFCFDATLRDLGGSQLETVKFILIAFLGFIFYFSYISVDVLISSSIWKSTLVSGAPIIFLGLLLLSYSFARHPVWHVKISVSRNFVFGCLSISALIIYLAISRTILEVVRLVQLDNLDVLLPVTAFFLAALFIAIYLSPAWRATLANFITRNFFQNKYDYRSLWMKFSERSSGSSTLAELLPKVAEFIADTLKVRQVGIWLRSPDSESFELNHCLAPITNENPNSTLRVKQRPNRESIPAVCQVPEKEAADESASFMVDNVQALRDLRIKRLVPIGSGNEILAFLGIGEELGRQKSSPEDDQLLSSFGIQLGHLILNHKLSEELLLSREWEAFNRFASFIIHDLKNLATVQGMTLENSKRFADNPALLAEAFTIFHQTTEKMIDLIASLSVRKVQLSVKQQPINIIEVISNTFDELKVNQRNGLRIVTAFPPKEKAPMISGDRELLQKAFTNLLLNAIQSLPKGRGAVEVTVSEASQGRITAAIKDTGCGIPSEQLKSLFRPFRTTKKQGMGIGLCHTRSIIEVHGGRIRIESEINAGTTVEIELPAV